MSTHHLRTAALATFAAVLLSGGAGHAQASRPPVPTIEQRFEKPGTEPRRTVVEPRTPDADRRAMEEVRESQIITERPFGYGRPIFRLGQDYTLKEGDTVSEVIGVFANVRIDGHVDGDAVVTMGSATIGSTAVIDGSLVVVGGGATILPGAKLNRDLVVVGGTVDAPPDFSPRGEHVVIGTPMIGDSMKAILPWFTRGLLWGRLIVPDLGWIWAIVGIAFLVGLVLNHVFDRQVLACADTLVQRPLSAFLTGLLVMMVSGPLLIILAASIIGLAVVPFAAVALVVAKIIGKVGVTRAIGRSVIAEGEEGSRAQSLRSYVLGFAVIILAYMVPIIGLLTYLMVGTFGLGSAAMAFAARWRKERPVPPVAPAPQSPTGPPSSPSPDALVAPSQSPAPTFGAPAASAFVAAEPSGMAAVSESSSVQPAPPSPEAPVVPPPARPGPASGAPAGSLLLYPRASFFDRVAAFGLDAVLIAIAGEFLRSALWFRWRGDDGGFMIILLAYTVGFIAWKGTTLGGIICSVRVVRTTGENLRFIDALVRGLSAIFSVVALGIGVFWMLNDAERQMWHDKIAGTVVVKVPREMVLA